MRKQVVKKSLKANKHVTARRDRRQQRKLKLWLIELKSTAPTARPGSLQIDDNRDEGPRHCRGLSRPSVRTERGSCPNRPIAGAVYSSQKAWALDPGARWASPCRSLPRRVKPSTIYSQIGHVLMEQRWDQAQLPNAERSSQAFSIFFLLFPDDESRRRKLS